MITRAEARDLAEAYVENVDLPDSDIAIVLDDATIEKSWGWVFFYNSRKFIEIDDFSSQLAGNCPLIIERSSGQLLETGTARPIDFYLLNYEATGDPNMRPGRVVGLSSSSDGPDRMAAARLIARTTSLSIGAAKRGVEQAVGGQSLEVDAGSLENASSLCAALGELGFSASQLPEPAV